MLLALGPSLRGWSPHASDGRLGHGRQPAHGFGQVPSPSGLTSKVLRATWSSLASHSSLLSREQSNHLFTLWKQRANILPAPNMLQTALHSTRKQEAVLKTKLLRENENRLALERKQPLNVLRGVHYYFQLNWKSKQHSCPKECWGCKIHDLFGVIFGGWLNPQK